MFRNLRNSFRGNHIHIKKENFILDKILCCTLHHVILENTWLLERMYHKLGVIRVNVLEPLFAVTQSNLPYLTLWKFFFICHPQCFSFHSFPQWFLQASWQTNVKASFCDFYACVSHGPFPHWVSSSLLLLPQKPNSSFYFRDVSGLKNSFWPFSTSYS